MRISVFGLGYVGCVSAACLAREGHEVVGIDVDPAKVSLINTGRSPIVEEGLSDLIAEMVSKRRLVAGKDAKSAVQASDLSLICVGTPGDPTGALDLEHVSCVCREIGAALRDTPTRQTIVLRSTVLPGTCDGVVVPTLEMCSGKRAGMDFDVCVNPEFLREGSALKDFYTPPFTLIGTRNEESAATVCRIYSGVCAPMHVTTMRTAEMLKYACNSFHALKVTFANEIGSLCKGLGIDSHLVMDLFCQDTKLNLSPSYLKPGFAFGGSCLPKDVRALLCKAQQLGIEVPVLAATLQSNHLQIERAVRLVLATGRTRVGLLGLSFKPGTDDLRESPLVTLVEMLVREGTELAIYDPDVHMDRLCGVNRQYIQQRIPRIAALMRPTVSEVLECSDVVVIGNRSRAFVGIESQLREDHHVVDLARMSEDRSSGGYYQGICW